MVDLSSQLRSSGVDVVLDKWDLREGDDAIQFMERMVTDNSVTKVIMICDKRYVEKTDKRTGGVGTEAQIISSKIYGAQKQTKFAAIVTEFDDLGSPYVPAYYKSRIYIDMTDGAAYGEKFEQLLRWLFDKPIFERPPIGEPPAFLSQSRSSLSFSATPFQRRALDALTSGKPFANAAVEDYLAKVAEEIAGLRLDSGEDPFDDAVVASIERFLPVRNELVDLLVALGRYANDADMVRLLHQFLERLLPLLYRPENLDRYREWDWDNLKFIVHEIFLYSVTALIKGAKFEAAEQLLSTEFYFERGETHGSGKLLPYTTFYQYLRSLEHRAQRLGKAAGSVRVSIHADLLKDRAVGVPFSFVDVMQADFILYVRSLTADEPWWPVTALYARSIGVFEVFARSVSQAYFSRLKSTLAIDSVEDLKGLIEAVVSNNKAPKWDYHSLNLPRLTGLAEIGTKP